MRTQGLASRLARIERNERSGSHRLVVVETQEEASAARAFLQGRADVDMGRIIFVITGVSRKGQDPEDWLRAALGSARISLLTFLCVSPRCAANRPPLAALIRLNLCFAVGKPVGKAAPRFQQLFFYQ